MIDLNKQVYLETINFIKSLYPDNEVVSLHTPLFIGNEKKYLANCIDSNFVSYLGQYVTQFEGAIKEYTGARNAIAFVNGTSALHIALLTFGVGQDDEVLTQALTFVGTVNAIKYCNANPVFIDSDRETLGMSPEKLEEFLANNTYLDMDGICNNKLSKKAIKACVPVHVFGHPARIDKIKAICDKYNIVVIEDAAESLGSKYKGKHTGTVGKMSILSFNGNKIITTGGGGMILTDDDSLAAQARHISTTAKKKHSWEFIHDQVGYNYRMTNVNAAIGCAQMEHLDKYIDNKRELAGIYAQFFASRGISFFTEKDDSFSNYWLNVIFMENINERDAFLSLSNSNSVITRPAWQLMNKLPIFSQHEATNLDNAEWLADRIVNIPSSVRL
jgi:perosamine synthetase